MADLICLILYLIYFQYVLYSTLFFFCTAIFWDMLENEDAKYLKKIEFEIWILQFPDSWTPSEIFPRTFLKVVGGKFNQKDILVTSRWFSLKKWIPIDLLNKRACYVNKCNTVRFQETRTNKLTHFMAQVSFYTPRNHLKISSFLIFSGGIEGDQWHEIGELKLLEVECCCFV